MKPHWYHWQDDTLYLQLHVTTRARRDEFKGLLDNKICLRIKAPPVEGKANQYLLGLIAKEFKVSKPRTEYSQDLSLVINASPYTPLPDYQTGSSN